MANSGIKAREINAKSVPVVIGSSIGFLVGPTSVIAPPIGLFMVPVGEQFGLDRATFTPIFAAGRAAGWCAHVIEQRKTARLVRPASRYIGAAPAA